MRRLFLLSLLGALSACGELFDQDPSRINPRKLLPDNTPYIASLLDYSPDTTLVPLEVWVGYMTHIPSLPQNLYNPYHDPEAGDAVLQIQGIPLFTQVLHTAYYNQLKPRAEPAARVSISGPLGHAQRRVVFSHRGGGVYSAPQEALDLLPGERYRLDVALPDGAAYTAETVMPHPAVGSLLESYNVPVRMELDYKDRTKIELTDGSNLNYPGWDPFPFYMQHGSAARIFNLNAPKSWVREALLLRDNEKLNFEDSNGWMMEGNYGIWGPRITRLNAPSTRWSLGGDEKNSRMYRSVCRYLRITDINEDYLSNLRPEHFQFTSALDSTDAVKERFRMHSNANYYRDTTYFFRITNLKPAEGSARRAAGVFGASASRYLRTVNHIKRTWDPFSWNWRKGIAPEYVCD